jgi:hypothetical protein
MMIFRRSTAVALPLGLLAAVVCLVALPAGPDAQAQPSAPPPDGPPPTGPDIEEPPPPDDGAAIGPVLIRWKLKPGDVTRYTLTDSAVDTLVDAGNREMTMRRETIVDFTQRVTDVAADGTTASLTLDYERVRYTRTSTLMPNTPVRFDTDASEDLARAEKDISLKPFAALKDAEIRLALNMRTGRPTQVSGYDKLLDDIFEGLDGESFTALKSALREQFSNEAMRKALHDVYHLLPEQPVAVGGTWSAPASTREIALVGTITVDQEYALKAVETGDDGHRIAVISVTGTMAQTATAPAADGESIFPGFTLRGRLDTGKVVGTVRFDLDAGRIVGAEVTPEITVAITGTPKGDDVGRGAVPIALSQSITGTITLSIRPDPAAAGDDAAAPRGGPGSGNGNGSGRPR